MSVIAGDAGYEQQAADYTDYFLKHYVDDNSGLFYWGGHRFINLDTLGSEGPESKAMVHELKHHLPLLLVVAPCRRRKDFELFAGFLECPC